MSTVTVKKTATAAQDETDETNKFVTIAVAKKIKSEHWKNKAYSIDELFQGLSSHRTLEDKNNAAAFAQGSLLHSNINRKKENFEDVNLFVLDIDNKKPLSEKKNKDDIYYTVNDEQHVSLDKAKSLIEASGYKAIIYTSHSHSEETHRFRIVFPMAQSYALDSDAAKDKWEYFYQAMSADLGFTYDKSGERYSQAFYMPSCPQERVDIAESIPINANGDLLDWRGYENAATAMAIAGSHAPTTRKEYMYEGFPLRIWYAVYGETYDIVAAIKSGKHHDVIGDQKNGGWCIDPCPFEHMHSDTEKRSPSKTMLFNPDDHGRKFNFNCFGDHCSNMHSLDYLEQMLILGWLTLDMLKDADLGGGDVDAIAMAKNVDEHPTGAQIKAITHCGVLSGDTATSAEVRILLNNKTPYGMGDLRAIEQDIRNKKKNELKTTFSRDELKIKKRYKYITEAGGYYDTFLHYVKPSADIEKALYDKVDAFDVTPEQRLKDVLLGDDSTKFDKMCYRPGNHAMLITEEIEDHEGDTQTIRMLNSWRPSKVKPREGDVTPIIELIKHLFKDKRTGALMRKEMNYFLDKLACIIQKPHIKQTHAIVLVSKPGAGKGTLFRIMQQIVGEHNYVNPNSNEVNKSELGFLEGVQLAVVGETMSGDNRKVANDLKEPVTDTPIRIRKLYRDAYKIDNPALIILCSNFDNPIYIEKGDRRYFVHKITSEIKDEQFFDDLHTWIDNGGASIFMHYLQSRDLRDYNPYGHAMMTQAKRELQESSQGEAYNILQDKWDAKEAPFDKDIIRLQVAAAELKEDHPKMSQGVLKRFIRDKDGDQISNAGITYKGYDNSGNPNGGGGTHRLWAVRDLHKYQEAAANNNQELIGKAMTAGYSKRNSKGKTKDASRPNLALV